MADADVFLDGDACGVPWVSDLLLARDISLDGEPCGVDSISELRLAPDGCLDGEAGMLRLLVGLANGLDGLSDAALFCDGRLTNGLAFSGER